MPKTPTLLHTFQYIVRYGTPDLVTDDAMTDSDAFRLTLAALLNNQYLRLGDLGRWEDALAAITEAVEIRRELAAAHPDTFRPDLAASLNNLSTALERLQRQRAALGSIIEAVQVHRQLAAVNPDAVRPAPAGMLNNLSIYLGTWASGKLLWSLSPRPLTLGSRVSTAGIAHRRARSVAADSCLADQSEEDRWRVTGLALVPVRLHGLGGSCR